MNIEDSILDIRNSISNALKGIAGLRGMEAMLTKACGGSLPRRIVANIGELSDEQSLIEEDDEWFITKLSEVASTKDPVVGMLNLATVTARLKAALDRLNGRISKLSERISATHGSPECQNAVLLKTSLVESARIIELRISIALRRLFELRLYAINATLKITEKVCGLWRNGSVELRSAALRSSAAQSIASLGEWEKVATLGEFKVNSASGKGNVKI